MTGVLGFGEYKGVVETPTRAAIVVELEVFATV
jgi:hypothetical protein